MDKKKRALVVEGGAMRCIFLIGVLDRFIANDFYDFDLCIGVSAGSTTIAAYLAGMYGRNYRVTADYSTRKEFINAFNFIRGKHYMDLKWLWDHCERYDPLDVEKMLARGIDFYVGVTSVDAGEVEYIQPTRDNTISLLMASCAIPIVYRSPIKVNDKSYVDGGIADPIPIEEALGHGANEIVIIRSRKKEFQMLSKRNKIQDFLLRDYPKVREAVNKRGTRYNASIDLIRKNKLISRLSKLTLQSYFKQQGLQRTGIFYNLIIN